jgi:hypothetical protein
MRLSRAEFKQRLNQLETAMKTVDIIEDTTKFNIVCSPLYTIIDDFMNFLSTMCDILKHCEGDSALSYYVYELDFGAKYTPGCVTEDNGNICPLSNPDELYDDLCKSWGEYREQK